MCPFLRNAIPDFDLIVSEAYPRPRISSTYIRRRDTIHSGLPILGPGSGCEATVLAMEREYCPLATVRIEHVTLPLLIMSSTPPRFDVAFLDTIADSQGFAADIGFVEAYIDSSR